MTAQVKVALDVHALQVDGYADRGIGRYVTGYSAALARAGRVSAALLAPELPPPSAVPAELIEGGLLRWDCRSEARRLIEADNRLCYHVTAPFLHCEPFGATGLGVVPHWSEAARPRAVILHDLIPLRAPAHYLPSAGHLERYQERARWVAASDLILTNSAYTRREAIELLDCPEERVVEIGAGVSPYFSPPDGTDDELWKLHFADMGGRPFILTVGGSDWRKGTDRVIAAFGRLARQESDISLVVAGHLSPPWQAELAEAARAAGVTERVRLTGAISDELLRACYRRALVTVMASLAEGAGLPVLESAASGTPALASDNSALAESAATPLALFDPTDTDSLVGALRALIGDDQRRRQILAAQTTLAAQSSWAAVAAKAGAALDRLGDRDRRPLKAARLRRSLALVGPLPPDGGGIGVYNQRLLAAGSSYTDVTFDAISNTLTRPELPPGVGFVVSDAFGVDARAASYDQVIYTLGNSDGHLATIGLLLAHPGWLWLHEARLPAIATTALSRQGDDEFDSTMSALLTRAYPGRAPLAAARRAGRSHIDLVAAGVGLIGPLAERCAGILVNSRVARHMVDMDLAPLAARPPIVVLPPACPPLRPRRQTRRHDQVVAFGVVSSSKRPDLLVDAAAHGGWKLAFVGPCPDVLRQFIEERAALRGAEGLIEVVGSVDDGAWSDWLDRAELAVQLRGSLTGETSAAVLEELASGVPVLTNLASAAEFPSGTCELIHDPSPESLAATVSQLLSSPHRLAELSAAGQAFASAHQFSHLLEALLAATGETLPSRGS